jgi:regulator of protease activity HflC (stomatin/prohibitin superfamily)
VDLDESMIRAIAQQAEAERARRAKVINAEGELQASEKMLEAAEVLARRPEAMQLRYLASVQQVVGERSSTILFPLPLDFLRGFMGGHGDGGGGAGGGPGGGPGR